jgi:hypothetical protein
MKQNKMLILLTGAGVMAAMLSNLSAQLPVSRPGGSIPIVINGGGSFTSIGIPFTREPVARLAITSVNGANNVLTVPSTGVANSAWKGEQTTAPFTPPFSVMILTGSNRGRVSRIADNTGTTVSLVTAISGLAADDEFYVIPEWTLGTLFGNENNPSGLTSSSNINTADVVFIAIPSQGLVQYFHNGTRWRSSSSFADAQHIAIGLNEGALVRKKSAGNLSFLVQGTMRTGRQVATVRPGFNLVTYTGLTKTAIGTSGLSNAVTGSTNVNNADLVYVPNTSGGFTKYYFTGSNWRSTTSFANVNDSLEILPESAVIIEKRAANPTASYIVNEQFIAGQ